MKKKLLLCVAVSFMIFDASAQGQQNKSSLMDFFTGRANPRGEQENPEDKKDEGNAWVNKKRSSESIKSFPQKRRKVAKEDLIPSDQIPLLSDRVVESPMINEERLSSELPLKIEEENRIDEVFVNSFRGVTNLTDLLKNIQSNVESLTFGRMSNDDYNKLVQKKQKIFDAKKQYDSAILAYDKICAMEQILMDYNAVSEISVHFLSDIGKQEINRVQNTLFLTEIDSLGDGLTYIFKTPISRDLQNTIAKVHSEIKDSGLKAFSEKLLREIEKIPNELLEPEQYAKVERILKEIHHPVTGNFEEKCATLKRIVESYNDLKSIPFRLKKISSESVKKLSIRAVEDIFFEKMLNILRIMDEEHYSATAENDAEALAALNIKKALCKMLGGISYSGKEYKSNIELFRTTDSLQKKQSLLKDSIAQFNKAVDLFKIAVTALKSEGRHPKLKNIDAISTINEDIDKIFEKIAIYNKSTEKENARNVVIEIDEIPGKDYKQELSGKKAQSTQVEARDTKSLETSTNEQVRKGTSFSEIPTIEKSSEEKISVDDFDLEAMEKALKESENASLEANAAPAA
jgi:hypothetical protein